MSGQEQSESLTRAVLDYVRALVFRRPSTCWESVPRSSPTISPGAARGQHRVRGEPGSPGCGPLYLVCGLGSVLIIPLSLWLYGRGQLSITLPAGCPALRL